MEPHDPDDLLLIQELREEVARLLADALALAVNTRSETDRVQHVQDDAAANFAAALASRDLIGQAKGITMVAVRCDSDQAFALLRDQSSVENRKLIDIATEIVARVAARAKQG